MLRNWLTYLFVSVVVMGCSDDDDYRFPPMHTELAEVRIDGAKNVSEVVLDDGRIYSADRKISSNVADTTLRCLCSYSIDDSGSQESFKIYSISTVVSSLPRPYSSYQNHDSDPVDLLSQWESARYINAFIGYKTTDNGNHLFSFCEDSIVPAADGKLTAYVSLHHSRPSADAESYTKRIYVSFPKYYYEGKTEKVVLTIPTR